MQSNKAERPWEREDIANVASQIRNAYHLALESGDAADSGDAWSMAVAAVIPLSLLDAAEEERSARVNALNVAIGPDYHWDAARRKMEQEVIKWYATVASASTAGNGAAYDLGGLISVEVYRHQRQTVVDQAVGLLKGGGLVGVRSQEWRTGATDEDGIPVYTWVVLVYAKDKDKASRLLQEAIFPLPLPARTESDDA